MEEKGNRFFLPWKQQDDGGEVVEEAVGEANTGGGWRSVAEQGKDWLRKL